MAIDSTRDGGLGRRRLDEGACGQYVGEQDRNALTHRPLGHVPCLAKIVCLAEGTLELASSKGALWAKPLQASRPKSRDASPTL